MNSSIDTSRLEKVRRRGSKITARCPACAAEGGDSKGTHFFQNTETGQFGCAKHPGDSEHRRQIFHLVGIRVERDRFTEREWRRGRLIQTAQELRHRRVSSALRSKRSSIISEYPWTDAQARAESPEQRSTWLQDPRGFLAALFPHDALVWTGRVYESGQEGLHVARWKSVADWQLEPASTLGPMVCPATWKAGTVSRSGDMVESSPFTVLDFDGIDGMKPDTPEEIRDHRRRQV